MNNLSDELISAYQYLITLLNFRLRSVGELEFKLKEKGFSNEVIKQVISEAVDKKYVNDDQLARNVTENLMKYKSAGFLKVKLKLLRMRFDEGLVNEVLADVYTLEAEEAILRRVIKTIKLPKGNTREGTLRLANKLKNRGFRVEAVRKVIFG